MALFRCKMCGGELNITDNANVINCEYCGTVQTVPTGNDEEKSALFNRANDLRLKCEFDKASGIYESIVSRYPNEAEGWWGLVLCKFGIEYVDDITTGRKIPTCHRTSPTPIMDDSDFERACENADVIARDVYREEAKVIDQLQKQIISVVSKEAPYDIFICYKETDDITKCPTEDSRIAQEIYTALLERGYKVFFARQTLKSKAGTEYEPYIYAALKSARVMLAIGTKFAYYDAVWVKNEWKRFLEMMATDSSKHLIPCFKKLDAYDIPKEFKNLQALDMSDMMFSENLMRNIERFIPRGGAGAYTPPAGGGYAPTPNAAGSDSLIKRAFLFLEDGDFANANAYCEKALDINPEAGYAYLGKLMAELNLKKTEELSTSLVEFDLTPNYAKALRFADDRLRTFLTSSLANSRAFAAKKHEEARLQGVRALYEETKALMQSAKSADEYIALGNKFKTIADFSDSAALANECFAKAERIRRVRAEYESAYPYAVKREALLARGNELSAEFRKVSIDASPAYAYLAAALAPIPLCLIFLEGIFDSKDENIVAIPLFLASLFFGYRMIKTFIRKRTNKKRVNEISEELAIINRTIRELGSFPLFEDYAKFRGL